MSFKSAPVNQSNWRNKGQNSETGQSTGKPNERQSGNKSQGTILKNYLKRSMPRRRRKKARVLLATRSGPNHIIVATERYVDLTNDFIVLEPGSVDVILNVQ